VLAFPAGTSLGAYQGGAAQALVPRLTRPDGGPPTLAAAGTGTGAINALLSAIASCRVGSPPEDFTASPFWETWTELSLDLLAPGEMTCLDYQASFHQPGPACTGTSAYLEGDGVFTQRAFGSLRERIARLLRTPDYRPGCRVPVAVGLTSERQAYVSLGTQEVPTSRRTILFELKTAPVATDAGETRGPLVACQAAGSTREGLDAGDSAERWTTLGLPANGALGNGAVPPGCQPIDLDSLIAALVATSAVPPFMPPQPLAFCADSRLDCAPSGRPGLSCGGQWPKLCEERFITGAAFDRPALASSRALIGQLSEFGGDPDEVRTLVVDVPRARQPKPSEPQCAIGGAPGPTYPSLVACADGTLPDPDPIWSSRRGVRFYSRFLTSFLEVGQEYERQTLFRYKRLNASAVRLVTPRFPTTGTLLFTYGAFLDRRFAAHDYLAGRCSIDPEASGCALLAGPVPPALRWLQGVQDVAKAFRWMEEAGHEPSVSELIEHLTAREACSFDNALAGAECASSEDGPRFSMSRRPPLKYEGFAMFADGGQFSYRVAQQLLHRAEAIERSDRNDAAATGITLAELYASMRAADVHAGFQLGSASAMSPSAQQSFPTALAGILIPSGLGFATVGGGGLNAVWELFSLRPGQTSWAHHLRFTFGASLMYLRYDPDRAGWSGDVPVGPHVELWTRIPAMPRLGGMGVRVRYDVRNAFEGRAFRTELFVRPFWDRLEVALGFTPGIRVVNGWPDGVGVAIGLNDVNGLLFWLLHAASGTDEAYANLGEQVLSAGTGTIRP
jgi:hypothetical protein